MAKLCPFRDLSDCVEVECAVWDIDNAQCGALVSNCIKQPTNEINNLIEYLESSLGKTSERDNNSSIIVYLKNILGISSERDNNSSIIVFCQLLIKTFQEQHCIDTL